MIVVRTPKFDMFPLLFLAAMLYLLVRNMIDKYRVATVLGATKIEAFGFVAFNGVIVLMIVNGLLILPFPMALLQAAVGYVLLLKYNRKSLLNFAARRKQQPPST